MLLLSKYFYLLFLIFHLVLIKDDFDKAIEYFKSNSSQKEELDKEFMFSMYT